MKSTILPLLIHINPRLSTIMLIYLFGGNPNSWWNLAFAIRHLHLGRGSQPFAPPWRMGKPTFSSRWGCQLWFKFGRALSLDKHYSEVLIKSICILYLILYLFVFIYIYLYLFLFIYFIYLFVYFLFI